MPGKADDGDNDGIAIITALFLGNSKHIPSPSPPTAPASKATLLVKTPKRLLIASMVWTCLYLLL
jgi:hypothetical protein